MYRTLSISSATVSHPLHLPLGTSADDTDQVVITPESAGWSFCGLRVIELPAGGSRTIRTGDDEMVVLPLAGSATVTCDERTFELTGRADPFSGPSDFAYLPPDTEATVASAAGGRFALPSARAARTRSPAYGRAEDIPVELRGAGSSTRQLHNFCTPQSFPAEKLVSVECITPSGNWSSWPPHKHDTAGAGEAELEEIYYFEVAPAASTRARRVGTGFALFRLYAPDRGLDLCEEIHHGDVVLVPHGYHGPSMTAPGYDLYHLNVLAGPAAERTMAFCFDPAHRWITETWVGMAPDPRLPVGPTAS